MIKNAYQGGEIRKAAPPLNDCVASFLALVFCLIPVITIVIALWRMH